MGKAVLGSLKDYFEIIKCDLTRNAVVSRKVVLDSITGVTVRENNQLTNLAEFIGVRKPSVLISAKDRLNLESEQKLIPIVNRIQRKSPQGDSFLSTEWKLSAISFYENDAISCLSLISEIPLKGTSRRVRGLPY